jgi:hypothetical protein
VSGQDYSKEELWSILVETVHALVMYPNHKAYTRSSVLQDQPEIKPTELAIRLRMPLGEAIVILDELIKEKLSAG